ncbi:MAG: hypothetical protein JST49_12860 [Bacteroidetes bacterium]|nr:hypothetical protein [Bacteroidota bacterium]
MCTARKPKCFGQ